MLLGWSAWTRPDVALQQVNIAQLSSLLNHTCGRTDTLPEAMISWGRMKVCITSAHESRQRQHDVSSQREQQVKQPILLRPICGLHSHASAHNHCIRYPAAPTMPPKAAAKNRDQQVRAKVSDRRCGECSIGFWRTQRRHFCYERQNDELQSDQRTGVRVPL